MGAPPTPTPATLWWSPMRERIHPIGSQTSECLPGLSFLLLESHSVAEYRALVPYLTQIWPLATPSILWRREVQKPKIYEPKNFI